MGQPEHTSTSVELSLHTGAEYYTELQKDIANARAGDRVAVMTMSMDPVEPVIRDTLRALNDAASDNVDTLLVVDAYAMMIDTWAKGFGPKWSPITRHKAMFDRRQQALDQLNAQPLGTARFINEPSRLLTNPYAGRSHIKGAVINDRVYIGGPNLHDTSQLDGVVSFEHPDMADWFYTTAEALITHGTTQAVLGKRDRHFTIDVDTHISVDAGQPGQSVILEQALDHIDAAEDWLFYSSQLVPNGKVADRLIAAHRRGVDVQLAYNHPSQWGAGGSWLQKIVLAKQRRQAPVLFENGVMSPDAPSVHAKVLASEKGGMIGTHNLSDAGVAYGTPEIALFSRSPDFAYAIRRLVAEQIAVAKPRS